MTAPTPTPGALLDAETETIARYMAAGAADVLGLGDRVTGAGGWTGANWQKFVPQAKRLQDRLARPTPEGSKNDYAPTETIAPAQPEPGAGELEDAGHVVWWKEGGVNYHPQGEAFSVSKSCRVEPLVTRESAQAKIARLEELVELARIRSGHHSKMRAAAEARALSAEADAAKVREENREWREAHARVFKCASDNLDRADRAETALSRWASAYDRLQNADRNDNVDAERKAALAELSTLAAQAERGA